MRASSLHRSPLCSISALSHPGGLDALASSGIAGRRLLSLRGDLPCVRHGNAFACAPCGREGHREAKPKSSSPARC